MATLTIKLADGVEFLLPHLELTPDVEKTLMSLLHAGGYGGPLTSLLTESPGSTFQLLPLCKQNCDCAPHLRHLERQAATVTLPLHGRQSPSKLRAKPKKTVRKSTPTKVACRFCGKSIAKSGHARHVRDMHEVKQKFVCEPPCPYVCKRADHLKKHQKTDICVRGQFEKVCKICGEIVIGSMRTHSERSKCPGKHPCSKCSTSFANKDELLKHIENVHDTITEFTVIVV